MRLSVRTTCLTAIILFSAAFAGCASRPSVNETKETCSISETEKDSTMENVLYGGGMVCNATLFSGEEEEEFSYELPVFSRREIKEIKVDHYRISGEGDYKITQEETTAGDLYRGWYYYYIHLKVSARPDQPADFSIDSLDLNDDEQYRDADYIYSKISERILMDLENDREFNKLIYRYMLIGRDGLSGRLLCMAPYEQGVLKENAELYNALDMIGEDYAYEFLIDRIKDIDITPAQLL